MTLGRSGTHDRARADSTGDRIAPPSGEVRTEILKLVGLNQDSLIVTDDERAKVARIVEDRRNLRDRSLPT
jgi:hypothetical protein